MKRRSTYLSLVGRRGMRRPARLLAAVLVAGAVLAGGLTTLTQNAAPAAADSVEDKQDRLAEELKQLREDLEGTSDDLVEAAVRLKTAEARLSTANAQLKAAESALRKANERDAQLADELELAEAAVRKAQRELDARADEERETKDRLAGIAREAYVSSGMAGLSIALDAQSPEQFADRVSVAGNALRAQGDVIDRLAVEQAETRAREAKLEAGRLQVADLKEQSEQVVREREAATTQAQRATDEIGELVSEREEAVAAISARKAAEQKRIDDAESEQEELARILRDRARAEEAAPSGGGGSSLNGGGSSGLAYPVSAPITSNYGYRYHPILNYRRLHAGTDFGAGCGTPLRAAADGTIVRAGWSGGYGNQIVVDHGRINGSGVATSSNHLSRIVVRSGQVRQGQVIGYTGTTGLSTGCHLHFEVYVNGATVDPMGWL
ncbi:peptidoglycan DD-metalloendopeptidase family protein [Kineosporia babensis]|uniref:Peptidoglycan DD-metalloendopeptidase family protein n=1 Tax=Kineosporia babensis TaxID=499548 RepID=A0A9X1NKR0_9ACTN|nr:peptidoglycan DD-metalloendopeptidase family protein [Kineosporia babensis]MCD5316742.1 peptidoglycan DD-metalloendopeptidase family protein [Kineosporia babensis]